MSHKLNVGILLGGRSGEHEVSVISAGSVYNYLDRDRFNPVPIGISKEGRWYLIEDPKAVFEKGVIDSSCGPRAGILSQPFDRQFMTMLDLELPELDVVFPVLHGTFGEDGTVQGLLELAEIPYVGAGVAASAVGMDKVLMKKLFRESGLPTVQEVTVMRWEVKKDVGGVLKSIEATIPYPCFVKPANLGSSVGVSKAKNKSSLKDALFEASRFDRKIVVERGLEAREIECSVLGNKSPESSVVGEIIPSGEFYDYHAKYKSGDSELVIPAQITTAQEREIRRLAVEAFKSIDCAGFARVDFLLTKNEGEIYVNEINTIPGFTEISMYPKLWDASGLPYGDLLSKLIELAIECDQEKRENETTYSS